MVSSFTICSKCTIYSISSKVVFVFVVVCFYLFSNGFCGVLCEWFYCLVECLLIYGACSMYYI